MPDSPSVGLPFSSTGMKLLSLNAIKDSNSNEVLSEILYLTRREVPNPEFLAAEKLPD